MQVCGAVEGGHTTIIDFMIQKGADWNAGMRYACLVGSYGAAITMIEKGANDWDGGMCAACKGLQTSTLNLMLRKGANFNEGKCASCPNGHVHIVDQFVKEGMSRAKIEMSLGIPISFF
jgi:hypothetical protein